MFFPLLQYVSVGGISGIWFILKGFSKSNYEYLGKMIGVQIIYFTVELAF
jgi:hypothetical protein